MILTFPHISGCWSSPCFLNCCPTIISLRMWLHVDGWFSVPTYFYVYMGPLELQSIVLFSDSYSFIFWANAMNSSNSFSLLGLFSSHLAVSIELQLLIDLNISIYALFNFLTFLGLASFYYFLNKMSCNS